MSRAFLVTVALLAATVTVNAGTLPEVTYVTSSSVYVSAGERDGISTGTRFLIEAPSRVVLEAVETSATRTVCRVVEGSLDAVRVGATVAPAQAATEDPRETVLTRSGIHGRVGVRYLMTESDLNERAEFEQPALDLRLDGPALFGTPWGFHADVRARRTTRTVNGQDLDDDRNRVYRFAVDYDPAGPGWRFGAGRQPVPQLANVGLLDGFTAAYDAERWTAGAFAGTEPAFDDLGYSSDIRDYGGYFDWRSKPGGERRWALTAGAVASYEDSEVNRELVFFHGRYHGPRLFAYVTQEVDFNRDWKEDLGESTVEPTSTFASLRFKLLDSVSLVGGYDNRRNVRLYRDRLTPATAFDDEFRRGVWLGATARAGRHLRFGIRGRSYGGDDAGDADSYTVNAGVVALTRADLAVQVRATTFENDRLEGDLYTVDVSANVGSRVRVALLGGSREDESLIRSSLDESVTWYGIDVDVDLTRRLWATLSAEQSDGDLEEITQLYATLAYRF